MNKILLKASFGIKNGFPMITLSDEAGATWIGSVFNMSIEDLAREYQKDFEYCNKNKPFEYWVLMEGNPIEYQLFQKPVIHGYGEPNTYIDETNESKK